MNQESSLEQLFNERTRQIILILMLVEVVLWPLWIVFDQIFAPDLLSVLVPIRLFFCGFSILATLALYRNWVNIRVAQYLYALPPLGAVALMFNLVPSDVLFPYYIGGSMVLFAVFFFVLLPPKDIFLLGGYTILSIVLFKFFIGKHSYRVLIEHGGFFYLSLTLLTSGFAFVRFKNVRKEIKTTLLLEKSYKELSEKSAALESKNDQLQQALNEREMLLKEIHHRVKNNLQIISSLLHLQEAQTGTKSAAEILELSQNRLKTMAIIHEILYANESFSKVNIQDYLDNLLQHFRMIYLTDETGIEIKDQLVSCVLSIDQLIPCGLIVNEAVTNSIKYAFPKGIGQIDVETYVESGILNLLICDNGVGFEPSLDKGQSSIGLPLIRGLAQQLHGYTEVNSSERGTEIRLKFPIK